MTDSVNQKTIVFMDSDDIESQIRELAEKTPRGYLQALGTIEDIDSILNGVFSLIGSVVARYPADTQIMFFLMLSRVLLDRTSGVINLPKQIQKGNDVFSSIETDAKDQ